MMAWLRQHGMAWLYSPHSSQVLVPRVIRTEASCAFRMLYSSMLRTVDNCLLKTNYEVLKSKRVMQIVNRIGSSSAIYYFRRKATGFPHYTNPQVYE